MNPQKKPSDEYLQSIVKGCEIFVIEQDAEVVGLIAIRIMDLSGREDAAYKKIAHIMAIGVEEMKRRQRLGTALVSHVRHWLEAEGVEMVSLNVAARNSAAVAFYKQMGFETLSIQMGCKLDPQPNSSDRVKTRDAMSFSACAVVAMETLVVGSCSCDNPFLTGSDRLFEGKDTAFRVAELPLKP